jgi:DNA-binding transcriptional MerR regulator
MFAIGEFSRLAQLSVRVLRHYDEIGLFKPAHTNHSNGYRFYAAAQLADVQRIIALKELGLSLEQIQKVMNEQPSTDVIAGMLRLEQARAEDERRQAEHRLRELERRLAELASLGRLSELDVVEKSVDATPFLAYRAIVAGMDAAMALVNEISARCKPLGPWSPFVGVAHDSFFDAERLDLELGYLVGSPEVVDLGSDRQLTVRSLPAVERMLSVVYLGTQADGHRRSYHALAVWLEQHHCQLNGPGRELIHGPTDSPTQTIEIQYPIAERAHGDRLGVSP